MAALQRPLVFRTRSDSPVNRAIQNYPPAKRSRRRSEVGGWVRGGGGGGVRPWVYWALSGGDGGGGGGGRGPRPAPRTNDPYSNGSNGGAGALDAAAAGSRRTVRIPRPVPRPQCPRPSVRSSARPPVRPSARSSAVRPSVSSRGKIQKDHFAVWPALDAAATGSRRSVRIPAPRRDRSAPVRPSARPPVRPSAGPPARPPSARRRSSECFTERLMIVFRRFVDSFKYFFMEVKR